MARQRSIKSQLQYAISECNSMGESKRSARADKGPGGGIEDKVFSVSTYRDLRIAAGALANYLGKYHSEVRKVMDIKPEHIMGFMGFKELTCNEETMGKNRSHVRKLEELCKATYGDDVSWETKEIKPMKGSEGAGYDKRLPLPMHKSAELVEVLKQGADRKNGSQVWRGVEVGRNVGMRVGEVVKLKVENIHLNPKKGDKHDRWGYGYVHIIPGPEGGAKGGRERYIGIHSLEARQNIIKAIEGLQPGQYVITNSKTGGQVKVDTVNAAMVRAMGKLGIDANYRGSKMHGCRKAWSQVVYDQVRHEGLTRTEAKAVVNELLGHSGNREVIEDYVGDLW